jgi:circadian clock protein KaiC
VSTHAALFIFDEELGLLFSRSKAMGIDLESMRDSGKLHIIQVDAAEISPGEFAHKVREAVEKDNIRTVVIDSLNGYQNSMPQEQYLILHMHELLQHLNRVGAATFLTVAQHGMVGEMKSPVDVTYLADTVVLLRYFEAFGQVRRANFDAQERHRIARKYHSRIHDRVERHHRRPRTRKIPGHSAWSASICRC